MTSPRRSSIGHFYSNPTTQTEDSSPSTSQQGESSNTGGSPSSQPQRPLFRIPRKTTAPPTAPATLSAPSTSSSSQPHLARPKTAEEIREEEETKRKYDAYEALQMQMHREQLEREQSRAPKPAASTSLNVQSQSEFPERPSHFIDELPPEGRVPKGLPAPKSPLQMREHFTN